jgi:hypothetical protein
VAAALPIWGSAYGIALGLRALFPLFFPDVPASQLIHGFPSLAMVTATAAYGLTGDARSALALADARRGSCALHRARDRAQSSLPRPTPKRSNRRFRGGWLLVGGLCDRDSHLLVVFSGLGLANYVLQSFLADRGIDDSP